MIKILISTLTIPIVLSAWVWFEANVFQLPEFSDDLSYIITTIISTLWILNDYVAIDTLLQYGFYAVTIEFFIFILRQFDQIRSAITGASPLFTFSRFGGIKNDEKNHD